MTSLYKLLAAVPACMALLAGMGSLGASEKPHAVIVVGTLHYSPELTMPALAKELDRLGFSTTIVMGAGDPEKKTKDVLPGIDILVKADVVIFFMRFLKLPDAEWQPIEDYLKSGKPVIGLRTANHSFKYAKDHPRFAWNDGFGRRALGTPYIVHQGGTTEIQAVPKYKAHPIMSNIMKTRWTSPGTLYLTRLEGGCLPLATGTGTGRSRLVERPFGTIQVNEHEADIVAWAWENEWGARVFGTTLGHPGDFAEEAFTRMLVNGICWAVDKPLPGAEEEIATWNIQRADKKKK